MLGTVQLGLKYGINNKTGKPSRKDSFAILEKAVEEGINIFDTAAAYGDAEEILGEFIASRGLKNKVKVISKLFPNLVKEKNKNTEMLVLKEVKKSLQRLQLKTLDGFLLHTPTDFYNKHVIKGLQKCRGEGLIKHFGVSIYETKHALDVVGSRLVDYIQVPYNIFDQRLSKTDFFKIAERNNVKVFARSPFLQGLLFMEEDNMPPRLSEVKKYLREFDNILNKYHFSRLEACLFFSFMNPNIDYVVFGVETKKQLDEDIKAVVGRNKSSFDACMEELNNRFVNIKKAIIFPSLWSKK